MDKRKQFMRKVTIIKMMERLIALNTDKEKKIRLVESFAKYYSTQMAGIYADEYLEKVVCPPVR